MIDQQHRKSHWRGTSALAGYILLLLGLAIAGATWFTGLLDAFRFIGFPLGFFLVSQGILIAMIILVSWHVGRQERIDLVHGAAEDI